MLSEFDIQTKCTCLFFLALFLYGLYSAYRIRGGDFWGLFFDTDTDNNRGIEIEPQHLIRRKSDHYPLTVNDRELSNAMKTGDYEVIEYNYGGGFIFSGWVWNERERGKQKTPGSFADNFYIPPGYQIKEKRQHKDRRLDQ